MKLYFRYFSIQLKAIMQYKVSFILATVGQAMSTFFSFASIYFLFNRFGNIKGYNFNEVLLCFSCILVSFSLAECFGRGFDRFSQIIGNGEFDRIMVRPRNEILQVLGSKMEFSRLGRLIQASIVFIYAISTSSVNWNISRVVTLTSMILGGVALFFSLFMIYAAFCFFTLDGLEFMNIFTDGGREIAQYPLDIYSKWVLKVFTFFIPLACINYYPLLYLIGRSNSAVYMLSPMAAFLFSIPGYAFWKFGVRHYRSTGS